MNKRTIKPERRKYLIGLAVLELGFKLLAARDLQRRPTDAIRGSKRIWAPLLLVNFVGPLAYFVFGRRHPSLGSER